jgi:hypothetical protein
MCLLFRTPKNFFSFMKLDLLFVKRIFINLIWYMYNHNIFSIFCAEKHVIQCLVNIMLTHHCQHSHVDLWLAMLEFVMLSWFCCINAVLYRNQKSERHGSGNLAGQVIELLTLLKSPLINNMFIRVVKIYWRVLYMVQHF